MKARALSNVWIWGRVVRAGEVVTVDAIRSRAFDKARHLFEVLPEPERAPAPDKKKAKK